MEMGGFTTSTVIPFRLRNKADFCFDATSAEYVEDFNTKEYGNIKITMSSAFTVDEYLNMSIIDEAYYEGISGEIKLGTQNDATSPADVGTGDAHLNFSIIVG